MKTTTPTTDLEGSRRGELANFLRTTREATKPDEQHAARRARRRTPGLLREEVAVAAGISTTWYVWLEQARPIRVSPRALDGLARALKLDPVRRAYLFRLARPDLQPSPPSATTATPGAALVELVRTLSPHPAYAMNSRWDVVARNKPADVLFGGFDLADEWSRNLLARIFLDPRWRKLFPDWELIARSSVGQFRAATTELTASPEYQSLLRALERASPEFAALWARQEVFDPPVWRKTFFHPQIGGMTFAYSTFRPEGESQEFRLTVYTPVDSETMRKLQTLVSSSAAAAPETEATSPVPLQTSSAPGRSSPTGRP
jgi:transcriptional regulator with XRE-family HTH domain